MYKVARFPENPLIYAGLDDHIGKNINGPSIIRVPSWIPNPLGKYYLYFAHHEGTFIRMAYADALHGPWKIRQGGVLDLSETRCDDHIASPDVHILEKDKTLRMYFHGVVNGSQHSFLATSLDGLSFHSRPNIIGPWYLKAFKHENIWLAIAKRTDAPGGGVLLRSPDGVQAFQQGPPILPNMRHAAVLKRCNELQIFFTRGGDCPERILISKMSLEGKWEDWSQTKPEELMRPETAEEGAQLPLKDSEFEAAYVPVNELRDPAIYEENGEIYLFYTGAGEANICGATLLDAL